MSLYERPVTFDCGHKAKRRIARNGRSLIGESLRCHECHVDKVVTKEGPAKHLDELIR